MDFKKVAERKKDLKTKANDELVKIYADNDRKAWSEEEFEAIRQILQERGYPLPRRKGVPPPQQQAVSPHLSKYEGIRGWLFFFCISLTILVPLKSGYNIYQMYIESPVANSFYSGHRDFKFYMFVWTYLSVGITLFSMIAGISLWAKKPGAVRLAKAYLFTFMFYVVLITALPFALGLLDKLDNVTLQLILQEAIIPIAVAGLWRLYLNDSKRIKATYR